MTKFLQILQIFQRIISIGLLLGSGYLLYLVYPAVKSLPELALHANALVDESTLTVRNIRKTTQIVEDNSQQEAKSVLALTQQGTKTLAQVSQLASNTDLAINQQLVPGVLADVNQTQLELAGSLGNADLEISALSPGISDLNGVVYNIRTLTGSPDIPATFLAIKNSSEDLQGASKDVHQATDMYIQKIRDKLKPVPLALRAFDLILRIAEPAYYAKGVFE